MVSNFKGASFAFPHKNNTKISFTGFDAGKVVHLKTIQKLSNCQLDDLYKSLQKNVAPDFFQNIGDSLSYKKTNFIADAIKFPFVDMPKEFLNFIAKKFNIQSLQNSKLLTDFQNEKEKKAYERAMRGLLQNGDAIIDKVASDLGIDPKNIDEFLCKNRCNPEFKKLCEKITDEFNKIFDENLSKTKAHYNTTHERTIVRFATGITAAIILGNDFYNKAILNGKDDKEAKISQKKKRTQELIETVQEALAQYFMLSALTSTVNNSNIAAPIINTALSLLFRITSRLSTGRPIIRIKVPNKIDYAAPTIDEFKESPMEQSLKIKPQAKQENKKHLLSPKNIIIACLASIGLGFAGRGIKSTKGFEQLKEAICNTSIIKSLKEKYINATIGEVWASKDEINTFLKTQRKCDFEKNSMYFRKKLITEAFSDKNKVKDGKLLIGEYEKITHIPFTKIQVSKKELLQLPLSPFKLIYELASYPYRLVKKILEAGGKIAKNPPQKLKNEYNIVNTYIDYKEKLQANRGIIDDNFIEKYSKHLKDNRISALNKETQSSINNSAIGQTTQTMGTFASLYFAMADDYNETAKQTGDKEKAQKDARLRGVNKIIRMSTQTICLQLNNIFKVSYAKSLLGAGIISVFCTLLTDNISRKLSGMPNKKMNKEQLEQYNNDKKNGVLKGYYNALDKLTD